jgi:DNA-binding transcriptional MerR regulator
MKYRTTQGKMYYSISEVSEMTGVKPHVLRYWETEFPSLRPKKNRAGNRNYRPKDIKAVLVIRDLLYKEKFTISGARKKLQEHYGNPDPIIDQMQIPFSDPHARQILLSIKNELNDLKGLLFADDKKKNEKPKVVKKDVAEAALEDSAAKSP